MSGLVIFLTVVMAVIVPKNVAGRVSIQDIDVAKLLDLVQKQSNHHDRSESSDSDSDDSDSSDEGFYMRTERVGKNNIADLIRHVINTRNDNKVNRNHKPNKERASNVAQVRKHDKSNQRRESSRAEDIASILNQFINKNVKKSDTKWQPRSKASKKHVKPNRLLWDSKDGDASLDEYSKVYILLNPQAIQNTRSDKNAVNQLISKVLSLSSSPSNQINQRTSKQNRYKGFVLKDFSGRRRGSGEMYAPDDSMEDKTTKRGRNNGGGGGGHTAIPYIRHRGENIYERNK